MIKQSIGAIGNAARFCAIFCCMGSVVQATAERPPNMVFFFCDNLGYADLGCYGHPYAKTPAIDRLAKEGPRFEQHDVTGVTCNPSRTGLMSGLFSARFPQYCADYGMGDRVSITELLKKRGYKTGHFGKWHVQPLGYYAADKGRPQPRHRVGKEGGAELNAKFKELLVAELLFECGDHHGRGREILEAYTKDVNGHFAAYAYHVLTNGIVMRREKAMDQEMKKGEE